MRSLPYMCAALLAILLLSGCSGVQPQSQGEGPSPETTSSHSAIPTWTALPIVKGKSSLASSPTTVAEERLPTKDQATAEPQSISASSTPLPGPAPTLAPEAWRSLPIIPTDSETTRQIYRRGLELGNNLHAFSKIGDCGSTPAWFLGDFDRGPKYYRLGEYQNLDAVIQQFSGSFGRTSLAAKSGFNASSVFATLWSDRSQCGSNETPLACEYRLNKPVIAFIMLGTNDVWHKDSFETQMRNIIEFSIENGVVPILSTKADNDEGDGSINATIANLAVEYDLPLWNFWLAVQPLPDQGLQPDQAHITWGPNRFDDPQAMEKGWTIRNLTALQTLDAVWRGLTGEPPAN